MSKMQRFYGCSCRVTCMVCSSHAAYTFYTPLQSFWKDPYPQQVLQVCDCISSKLLESLVHLRLLTAGQSSDCFGLPGIYVEVHFILIPLKQKVQLVSDVFSHLMSALLATICSSTASLLMKVVSDFQIVHGLSLCSCRNPLCLSPCHSSPPPHGHTYSRLCMFQDMKRSLQTCSHKQRRWNECITHHISMTLGS